MSPIPTEMEENGSFWDHLEALRYTLIRVAVVGIGLAIPGYWVAGSLIEFLVRTVCPEGFTLHYFAPMEPLTVQIKMGCMLALAVGFPYGLWEGWRFVSPAFPTIRISIFRWIAVCYLLALTGASFCYFAVLPLMVRFSLAFETETVKPVIGMADFISLTGWMMAGFAVIFQFPAVLGILMVSGWVSARTLSRARPTVIVGLLIISAILTPPDVISQLVMFFPTYLLFEGSLFLGGLFQKSREKRIKNFLND